MGGKNGTGNKRVRGRRRTRARGTARPKRTTQKEKRFMRIMRQRISAGGPSHPLWHVTEPVLDAQGKPKLYRSGIAKGLPKRDWIKTPKQDTTGGTRGGRVPGLGEHNVFQAGHSLTNAHQTNDKLVLEFAETNAQRSSDEAKGVAFKRPAVLIDDIPVDEVTAGHLARDTRVPNFTEDDLRRAPRVSFENYDDVVPDWRKGANDPLGRRRRAAPRSPALPPDSRGESAKPRGKGKAGPAKTDTVEATGRPARATGNTRATQPDPPAPSRPASKPKAEPTRATGNTRRAKSNRATGGIQAQGRRVTIDARSTTKATSKIKYGFSAKAVGAASAGLSVFGALATFDSAVSKISLFSVGGRDPLAAALWQELQADLPHPDSILNDGFGKRYDTGYRNHLDWLVDHESKVIFAFANPDHADSDALIGSFLGAFEQLEETLVNLERTINLLSRYINNAAIIEPKIEARSRALFEIQEDLLRFLTDSYVWVPFVHDGIADLWLTFHDLSQSFNALHSDVVHRANDYNRTIERMIEDHARVDAALLRWQEQYDNSKHISFGEADEP